MKESQQAHKAILVFLIFTILLIFSQNIFSQTTDFKDGNYRFSFNSITKINPTANYYTEGYVILQSSLNKIEVSYAGRTKTYNITKKEIAPDEGTDNEMIYTVESEEGLQYFLFAYYPESKRYTVSRVTVSTSNQIIYNVTNWQYY